MGLVLALACLMSATSAQFNNEVPERQIRDRPRTYCGRQLAEVLMLVCASSRGKRHAVAEPYRMSPFMMSIYRPSIDDEDKWAAEWASDLKLESSPGMDFYNRINSLRVRILKILLRRVRESARRATRAFKRLQEPARVLPRYQEFTNYQMKVVIHTSIEQSEHF